MVKSQWLRKLMVSYRTCCFTVRQELVKRALSLLSLDSFLGKLQRTRPSVVTADPLNPVPICFVLECWS